MRRRRLRSTGLGTTHGSHQANVRTGRQLEVLQEGHVRLGQRGGLREVVTGPVEARDDPVPDQAVPDAVPAHHLGQGTDGGAHGRRLCAEPGLEGGEKRDGRSRKVQ